MQQSVVSGLETKQQSVVSGLETKCSLAMSSVEGTTAAAVFMVCVGPCCALSRREE